MKPMELISDLQDYLDGLPLGAKIVLCVFGIAIALIGARLVLINPWKQIVKESSAGWDDHLVGPLSARLNLFIIAAGLHLTITWLIENDVEYNNLQPYFGATYILIATSITSVSVKILMPVILELIPEKGCCDDIRWQPFPSILYTCCIVLHWIISCIIRIRNRPLWNPRFFGIIVFDRRYCNEADYQQYCKLIPSSNRPSFRGWRPSRD